MSVPLQGCLAEEKIYKLMFLLMWVQRYGAQNCSSKCKKRKLNFFTVYYIAISELWNKNHQCISKYKIQNMYETNKKDFVITCCFTKPCPFSNQLNKIVEREC